MLIHLDSAFRPFPNRPSIQYESFNFAGGEPHIKINTNFDNAKPILITHRIRSFNDLGSLLVCVDALRNIGCKEISLLLPYFPGARQDRIMVEGEPFTANLYANLINRLFFKEVFIFDPHSEVCVTLLNNVKVISNHLFIRKVLEKLDSGVNIVSPDAGAEKKMPALMKANNIDEIISCSKIRDPENGRLGGFEVHAQDLKGKTCLIVDDICDGGGTFLGLAEKLKEKNAGPLYLAVSHGIFSKGFEALEKHFEKIYCTNGFSTIKQQLLIQIPIETCLPEGLFTNYLN